MSDFAAAAPPAPQSSCDSSAGLSFVCGAENPEDLTLIPGTSWLVASGFSPGAGLKLVETRSGAMLSWYAAAPEQIRPDKARFAKCASPPDPKVFSAHGLSLRPAGRGRFTLYVINHGGRESVEVFTIDPRAERPVLEWNGCLPLPAGLAGNSVAAFSDGTVLVTVLTRPGTTLADFVQGRNTGAVYAWGPLDAGFRLLQGTQLPGNNGLETSPDDRRFYVVAFGWHAVLTFDRRDTRHPAARAVAPDFMPDNIHWSGDGLLAAGMRYDEPACGGPRKVIDGVADPMLCHRGYVVAELDPATGVYRTLAYAEPNPAFNSVSSAVMVDRELWLGSYRSDRLAHRPLPGRSP